jgi:hypothetical protein
MDERASIEDDEIEITLRPAAVVARRLVVLATLCRRAFLESRQASGELDEDPEMERFDLRMWLQDHDLEGDLTDDERRLFDAEVGALTADEAAAATWNSEALVALAWAVEMVESLRDPDQTSDPADILNRVPSPWTDPNAWLAAVIVRDENEIAQERERAEIWSWRADVEADRRQLQGRERRSLEADITDVVAESVAAGLLPAGSRGDFIVAGSLFCDLSRDRIDTIGGVADVRLHALNWLCGFGTAWDDVPLDID